MGINEDENLRLLEQWMSVGMSRRYQQALDAVVRDHSGCGEPDRVTDALVMELQQREIDGNTIERRRELRSKFGEPIASGEDPGSASAVTADSALLEPPEMGRVGCERVADEA